MALKNCYKSLIIIVLLLFPRIPSGFGEVQEAGEINLFQMIARAELVVHVRVQEGSLKYAKVEILRALKGNPPADQLRIAFREYNWLRPAGQEEIVFPEGQEEILFLSRDPSLKQKEKNRDIFMLYRGGKGRITAPAEGSGIIIEALDTLVQLTTVDPLSQVDGLLGLLRTPNLYLLEAAVDEINRLGAATPASYTDLVALLSQPSPRIRTRALVSIEQIFASGQIETESSGVGPESARAALGAVIERARNDEEADVRVRAVAVMGAWPDKEEIASSLAAIAVSDPSQMVRYQAERTLYQLGQSPPRR
jgi:hypothetical protein